MHMNGCAAHILYGLAFAKLGPRLAMATMIAIRLHLRMRICMQCRY